MWKTPFVSCGSAYALVALSLLSVTGCGSDGGANPMDAGAGGTAGAGGFGGTGGVGGAPLESTTTIGPEGGSAVLQDFATVFLPESLQRPEQTVILERIISPDSTALYESETIGAGPSLPELLRIDLSDNQEPVGLQIVVPPSFVAGLPPDYRPQLFARFVQLSGNDERLVTFEILGASYDPITNIATATVPFFAFAPSNSVSTQIVIGSYKNAPQSGVTGTNIIPSQDVSAETGNVVALEADLMFAIPGQISNALCGSSVPPVVTDGIGLRRKHPVTGDESWHYGEDWRSNHQPVCPVLPGKVARSGPQGGCALVNGVCQTGYGHRVTIDHGVINGANVETRYAHLEPTGLPNENDQVTTSDQIGLSDSTGIGTGPHLHIEYRINGHPVSPSYFVGQVDAAKYLSELSVVTTVNGTEVPATRRAVTSENFQYRAMLDVATLKFPPNQKHKLAIVLQSKSAKVTKVITSVNLTIKKETNCFDGADNDGDGPIDCADSDCRSNPGCGSQACDPPPGLEPDDIFCCGLTGAPCSEPLPPDLCLPECETVGTCRRECGPLVTAHRCCLATELGGVCRKLDTTAACGDQSLEVFSCFQSWNCPPGR